MDEEDQDKTRVQKELDLAIEARDAQEVSAALNHGADPNFYNPDENAVTARIDSPLFHATLLSEHRIVSILLQAGANPNYFIQNKTPLFYSKRGGIEKLKTTVELLTNGARIDIVEPLVRDEVLHQLTLKSESLKYFMDKTQASSFDPSALSDSDKVLQPSIHFTDILSNATSKAQDISVSRLLSPERFSDTFDTLDYRSFGTVLLYASPEDRDRARKELEKIELQQSKSSAVVAAAGDDVDRATESRRFKAREVLDFVGDGPITSLREEREVYNKLEQQAVRSPEAFSPELRATAAQIAREAGISGAESASAASPAPRRQSIDKDISRS